MVQETVSSKQEINLEDPIQLEDFQVEMHEMASPEKLEQSKQRLHELSMQIDDQMKQSRMTINKLFKNIGRERGLKKVTSIFGHITKYFSSQFDESTMDSSLRFLGGTVKAFEAYRNEIPVHIRNFQTSFTKLTMLKKQCVAKFKEVQKEMKEKIRQKDELVKKIAAEKKEEVKEELTIKLQEMESEIDNMDFRMRRLDRDLKNANITSELHKTMKKTYEILLKQVDDFVIAIRKHQETLGTIGPAVAEVQKIVQTFDKFAQAIDEHKKRDNICVRLSTRAVQEITGTVQYTDRPWFTPKTVEEAKKNEREAREGYRKAFGQPIPTLEEYNPSTGKPYEEVQDENL